MKRSFTVKRECVAYIIGGLQYSSMTLMDIAEYLEEQGITLSPGELKSIVTGLYYLGLIDRHKTRKKSYKYQILKPKNP